MDNGYFDRFNYFCCRGNKKTAPGSSPSLIRKIFPKKTKNFPNSSLLFKENFGKNLTIQERKNRISFLSMKFERVWQDAIRVIGDLTFSPYLRSITKLTYPIPGKSLPDKPQMEGIIKSYILTVAGIFTADGPIPPLYRFSFFAPIWEECQRLQRAYPELFSRLHEEALALSEEKKETHILPVSPETKKLFCFLGYEDEESFKAGILKEIEIFSQKHGLNFARIRQTFEFAEFAYRLGKQPQRKTGETYIAHPLRALWYYLTFLEKHKTQEEIIEEKEYHQKIVELLLLHDVLEDVPWEETPSPYYQSEKALRISPWGSGGQYVLDAINPEKTSSARIIISQDILYLLHVLTRKKDNALISEVTDEDPTGQAAIVKFFERLDNVLTSFHYTSYLSAIRKMEESQITMGRIGWHGFFKNIKEKSLIFDIFAGKANASIAAVSLLAGIFKESYFACFKKELFERAKRQGIDLEPLLQPQIVAYIEKLTSLFGQNRLPYAECFRLTPWERIAWTYRKKTEEKNFRPLGFDHLLETLNFAQELLYRHILFFFPFPLSRSDFWRKIDLSLLNLSSAGNLIPRFVYQRLAKI